MTQLVNAPPLPELQPLDPGFPNIQFQFTPDSFTRAKSGVWPSQGGITRRHPIIQYTGGEQETFSFEAKLFARHNDDDVSKVLDELIRGVEPDDDLGRPPRWAFVWGTIINETVILQSIGNIRYDEIRPDGTVRGVLLAINLMVYRGIDVVLTGAPLPDTFYTPARSGDQWEDLAQREYGDALLGDLLRRRAPFLLFPGTDPGHILALPPEATIRNDVLEPDSPPLRRTAESLELRRSLFEKRGAPRESTVVLR